MNKVKRIVQIGLLGSGFLLLAGLAAPYVNAESYRTRIQSALENSLNRRVKVGKVRFNLFTGPGFTVENVEIADDPSAGIEPLAYVDALEARVHLSSLWGRKLSFSNLRLNEPTLNLVRRPDGVWNFQLLQPVQGVLPNLQVRDGRINLKFGEDKSVFFLSQSDLDVTPLDRERMDVRFAGQPARTDLAARSFGMLLARGIWKRSPGKETELDVNAEMERSAISELARIIEGHPIGLHGLVSSRLHVSGKVNDLSISGHIRLEDVHRWDLIQRGGGWQLNVRGKLDLAAQRLELETPEKDNPGNPVRVRFRASDVLSRPRWATSVDMKDVPAAAVLEAARHMGATLPEGMQVEGKLKGAVGYSRPGGLQGQLEATDAVIRTPDAPPLQFRSANLLVDGERLTVGPSTVEAEGGQAEFSASYGLSDRALDVRLTTPAMNARELQKASGIRLPLIASMQHGTWKGTLRYQRQGEEEGDWSGDFEIRDGRFDLPGLAEPVRLSSASVSLSGDRAALTRMRGRAGDIRFTGEYHTDAPKPDRIKLEIPQASTAQLERLLLPTLNRRQGILARFRLRAVSLPEWLHARRLDGSVTIDELKVDDQAWRVAQARFEWNGASVKFTSLDARREDLHLEGKAEVSLTSPAPLYKLSGKASGIEFKGGNLSLEGSVEARGLGTELLAAAHGEGTFEGENVAFSPEMEFRTIAGAFEWSSPSKLKLKNLQAGQGFDSYTGQGATQPDGKLVLELTSSGKRQLKVAGTPFR